MDQFRPTRHRREILLADWQDAEELAQWFMRTQLGMHDAKLTARGNDQGIDVASSRAAAQVKHYATPVGAPEVQQALGAAHGRQETLFFALSGYTPQAKAFADAARVALFTYNVYGDVLTANEHAQAILRATGFSGKWSRAKQETERLEGEARNHLAHLATQRRRDMEFVRRVELQVDAEQDDELLAGILAQYGCYLGYLGEGSFSLDAEGLYLSLTAARNQRTQEIRTVALPPMLEASLIFLKLHGEVRDLLELRRLTASQWIERLSRWRVMKAEIEAHADSATILPDRDEPTPEALRVKMLSRLVEDVVRDPWTDPLAIDEEFEEFDADPDKYAVVVKLDPLGRGEEWGRRVLTKYDIVKFTGAEITNNFGYLGSHNQHVEGLRKLVEDIQTQNRGS